MGNDNNVSKGLRYGQAPVCNNSRGAKDFFDTYSFFPTDAFTKEPDGSARNNLIYTFWNDRNRLPIYDSKGEVVNDFNAKAEYVKDIVGIGDGSSFNEYTIFGYPVDCRSSSDYLTDKCESNTMHPCGIEWFFIGTSCEDDRGNAITTTDPKTDKVRKVYSPVCYPVTLPGNRVKLYDMFNKLRRFPKISDINLNPGLWGDGMYQTFRGMILMEGLHEGSAPQIKAKARKI